MTAKSSAESSWDCIPILLKPREAAAILRISTHALSEWRASRRCPLRFVRFGRSIRYRQDDVLRFIESCSVGGKPSKEIA